MKLSVFGSQASIYSNQPWFVMSAIHYEIVVSHGIPGVSHFYEFQVDQTKEYAVGIPDGCIDILFDCNSNYPIARVAGTQLQAGKVRLQSGKRYFGVRFLPGYIPSFLDISASDLVEKECDLLAITPSANQLVDNINNAMSLKEKVIQMGHFLGLNPSRRLSCITQQTIKVICNLHGNLRIQLLEHELGFSRRTLERRFRADLGLSPKSFCKAIRCQTAVYEMTNDTSTDFARLAQDLGFFDQSHFLREFKKLVSVTPLKYQRSVRQQHYNERLRIS